VITSLPQIRSRFRTASEKAAAPLELLSVLRKAAAAVSASRDPPAAQRAAAPCAPGKQLLRELQWI